MNPNENIIIFYHENCLDGFCAASILFAALQLKNPKKDIYCVPITYNNKLNVEAINHYTKEIFFVDFCPSVEQIKLLQNTKKQFDRITVLDHHQGQWVDTIKNQYSEYQKVRDMLPADVVHTYYSPNVLCGTGLALWYCLNSKYDLLMPLSHVIVKDVPLSFWIRFKTDYLTAYLVNRNDVHDRIDTRDEQYVNVLGYLAAAEYSDPETLEAERLRFAENGLVPCLVASALRLDQAFVNRVPGDMATLLSSVTAVSDLIRTGLTIWDYNVTRFQAYADRHKRQVVLRHAETGKPMSVLCRVINAATAEATLMSDYFYSFDLETPLVVYEYMGDHVKLSFRCHADSPYDIAAVAKLFGGGGHIKAAAARPSLSTFRELAPTVLSLPL
ncbi:MAG: hypothetical protein [Bacteriophage sp.]|nr:MAG: hypothetical protein [Bacteriophage sp.]